MSEFQRIRKNKKALRYQQNNAKNIVWKRWRNKMLLIQYKGGKCKNCEYDKQIVSAYHFHHRDPKEKEFTLCRYMSCSLEKLKREADKCDLLCANCHAEEHEKQHANSKEQTIKRWEDWNIEEQSKKKKSLPKNAKCQFCNNEYTPSYRTQIFCSHECSIEGSRKIIRPSKKELDTMLETMSLAAVGRKFGVSDNTIKRWYKQYQDLT